MNHVQSSPEQDAALSDILTRFGCEPDDYRAFTAFDLPPKWVYVVIGERKGRPLHMGISPEGEIST